MKTLFREHVEHLYDQGKAYYGEDFVAFATADPSEIDCAPFEDPKAFQGFNREYETLCRNSGGLQGEVLFKAVVEILQGRLDADGLQLQLEKREEGFYASFAKAS